MKSLMEYVSYHRYINENIDKYIVLSFDDLVNEPCKLIDIIEQLLDIKIGRSDLNNKIEDTINEIKSTKTKTGNSGWRSAEKDELKKKALSEIEASSLFAEAKRVYNEILDKQNNNNSRKSL